MDGLYFEQALQPKTWKYLIVQFQVYIATNFSAAQIPICNVEYIIRFTKKSFHSQYTTFLPTKVQGA